jgi:hypothetical protein
MKTFHLICALLFIYCAPISRKQFQQNTLIQQRQLENARFTQNRIFLDLILEQKDTISFYTDTGGGRIIYPDAVELLGLTIDTTSEGDHIYESVDLNEIFAQRKLPQPNGKQFVYRTESSFKKESDGMLGAN